VFLVVWGGEGPFTEDDWLRVSLDVAVATMKNSHRPLSQKNPGDLPGQTLIREHKETHVL